MEDHDAFHGYGEGDEDTEAGVMPSETLLAAMGRFNEEMAKVGVMLSGEGLHPSVKGARIKYAGAAPVVTEGPFPVSSDLVCGFWLIEVGSRDEAIQWMKRAPFDGGAEIELRQIFSSDDFGKALTPELPAQEERLRVQAGSKK